jgi:hypothetical protein
VLSLSTNITASFIAASGEGMLDEEVASVLEDSIPIIMKIADEFGLSLSRARSDREPLITT